MWWFGLDSIRCDSKEFKPNCCLMFIHLCNGEVKVSIDEKWFVGCEIFRFEEFMFLFVLYSEIRITFFKNSWFLAKNCQSLKHKVTDLIKWNSFFFPFIFTIKLKKKQKLSYSWDGETISLKIKIFDMNK